MLSFSVLRSYVDRLEKHMSGFNRLYIAAPFELQDEAKRIGALCEAKGLKVTSSWFHEDPSAVSEVVSNSLERAQADMMDLLTSHGMLLINPEEWRRRGSGGRHFETGVASASGLPIYIYGVRSNVFHHLESVRYVSEDIEEVIGAIRFTWGIDS